jgi:hypothetical protein
MSRDLGARKCSESASAENENRYDTIGMIPKSWNFSRAATFFRARPAGQYLLLM